MSLWLVLLGLLFVGLASPVSAAEFREGGTVVIGADEVIDDDLFVTAERVEVNGTVKGNLFASGSEVIVNGRVEGSTFLGAQSMVVDGTVDGTLFVGGYALTLGEAAAIDRNLFFGGFSLTAENGSTVGRSLYVGGYQAILDGDVANDVRVGAAALELNGRVGGDVIGEVGDADQTTTTVFMPDFPQAVDPIDPGLRVGDEAQISGQLDVEESTTAETIDERSPGWWSRSFLGLGRLLTQRLGEFIALLIVGAILLRYWPAFVQRVSTAIGERPLPSAGWGCLVTLLFPAAVFIGVVLLIVLAVIGGFVTFGQLVGDILGLGGAALGLTVAGFAFVFFTVTKVVVAYLGGRLILTRAAPHMEPGRLTEFWALALGAFIYELLRLVPILGPVVAVVVILVGLGAILLAWRGRERPSPAKAAV